MTDKIKILLADDHQLVRKGFRALLEELDFVEIVGEAANGKEAVNLLRNGAKPNIALLDYEMPQMNGLEATVEIRRDFLGVKADALISLYRSLNDPKGLARYSGPEIANLMGWKDGNQYLLKALASLEAEGLVVHRVVSCRL